MVINMNENIQFIKKQFQAANLNELPVLLREYQADSRAGVIKICEQGAKRIRDFEIESARMNQMLEFERKYKDAKYICGIDEVGRGPLAGPVMAGAVILPKDDIIYYLNDSKKLTEKKREELYLEIIEKAVSTGIGTILPNRIDEINILQATYEAMRIAINNLDVTPDILLVDAVTIPNVEIPQIPIIKGDAKSASIAAASILAKVTRDRLMIEYDQVFPEYEFASNKGYGSQNHIDALKKYGPTAIHRTSFIKNFL